jgi:hypothetical protein
LPRFDFCGIIVIAVAQMIHQVADWKHDRISSKLRDMNEFMQDEFDRSSIAWVDRAILGSQIHTIPERQSCHIPISRKPPKWDAFARTELDVGQIAYRRKVNRNPRPKTMRQVDPPISSHLGTP